MKKIHGRGERHIKKTTLNKNFETNYFDRFRSVWYHEIGHHIHQMYNQKIKKDIGVTIKEPNYKQVDKPLENRLNKVRNIKDIRQLNTEQQTRDGLGKLSLYYRGKGLVAPEFLEILEEIKDGKLINS